MADNEPEEEDQEELELEQLLQAGYENDLFPAEVRRMLENGVRQRKKITWSESENVNGRLYYRKRLYIPAWDEIRLYLVREHHDPPAAGHPGR